MGIRAVQAYFISPPVVTNGLVFYVNAADTISYSGGTAWRDLIGSNTGTLINSPTFNTLVGGNLQFNGIDEYVSFSGVSLGTVHSVEIWINPSNTNDARWIGATEYDTHYLGLNGSDLTIRVNVVTATVSNAPIQVGAWNHIVITRNDTEYSVYVNSALIASQTESLWSGYTFTLNNIGVNLPYGFYGQGFIGSVKGYNRVLSNQEVLQNYNAHKAKFGLL